MALIDVLNKASFKGVECLVKNSTIKFGQKTVTHEYPNANRSEVEFLGIAEDEFSMDLYIHSSDVDYISKRNALKQALSSSGAGNFIHPYEGNIRCSVIGQPSLTENDREFGIAKFSVVFKKTSKKTLPAISGNNRSYISNLVTTISNELTNYVQIGYAISGLYASSDLNVLEKLRAFSTLVDKTLDIVPLDADDASEIKKSLDEFDENIIASVQDVSILTSQLANVFSSIDRPADNILDNLQIYELFFNFGQGDSDYTPITQEQIEIQNNDEVINEYVTVMTLAMSYEVATQYDYSDDVQMNEVSSILEEQYNDIIDKLKSDARFTLNTIRNNANEYFDNQDVRRVITVTVDKNPLAKICYLYYGNLDNFQRIYELNNKQDPSLYEGDIRILANG